MATTDIDQAKLPSPRIFLIRMLVFVILCALIGFVLQRQIIQAFFANPWLNALIIGVLCIGTILSFHQVIRLFAEVSWVNGAGGKAGAQAARPHGRHPGRRTARPRRHLGADHARFSRLAGDAS
jgi:hypothetical protein